MATGNKPAEEIDDKGMIDKAKEVISDAYHAVIDGAENASVDGAAAAIGGAEAFEDPEAARKGSGKGGIAVGTDIDTNKK